MSKQFFKFIAYLQVLTIVLVVFGHSFFMHPDSNHGTDLLIYRMMFSFRMPLFMFISGFLMSYTSKNVLAARPKGYRYIGRFMENKFRRLMIPYLTLTAVTFIPRALMSSLAEDEMELSWGTFTKAFIFPEFLPIPYFWFLQSCFTLLIICFLILAFEPQFKTSRLSLDIILITGSALLMIISPFPNIFSLSETCRLGIYFVLGIIYDRHYDYIDSLFHWKKLWFFFTVSILWSMSFFITEFTDWFFICSTLGIAMCISLAKILEANNIGLLDHLMGSNYMIFLLSWYCNVLCQQVLSHFVSLPWYVYTILSLITGIYIPWTIFRYMQTHKDSKPVIFAATLLGQKL